MGRERVGTSKRLVAAMITSANSVGSALIATTNSACEKKAVGNIAKWNVSREGFLQIHVNSLLRCGHLISSGMNMSI